MCPDLYPHSMPLYIEPKFDIMYPVMCCVVNQVGPVRTGQIDLQVMNGLACKG